MKKFQISSRDVGRYRTLVASQLLAKGLTFTAIGQVLKVSKTEARMLCAKAKGEK